MFEPRSFFEVTDGQFDPGVVTMELIGLEEGERELVTKA